MSNLLCDTHVAVWWIDKDPRLGDQAVERILKHRADLSAASTWEVAIKTAIGKLRLDLSDDTFADRCRSLGFNLLDVTHADAWAVRDLPHRRADPFDRLIAATARRRGLTVVTADPAFADLGVATLDARA